MQPPRIPDDEADRLQQLASYGVLDTVADPNFDDISELARFLAGTEIGMISLVDSDRQWFKSCVGASLGQKQTPRDISFCGHTILQREPLIINDALEDPRFADNPLVVGDPFLRFYAGFPLISPNGFVVGSLCAISTRPHQLTDGQIDGLKRLAGLAVLQLEHLRESALLSTGVQAIEVERLSSMTSDRLSSLDRLINRDQMVQMLELMFGMSLDSRFSLLRCCFRDYERVNSNLGGIVAEEYMNEAARRVLAAVPRSASVARFADAEFVVLLPFTVQQDEVQKVAERILAFASHIYRSGSQSLPMTLSIGVAVHEQNYAGSEEMLADTSMAVRLARRSSGNAFRFIDQESRAAARASYRLESDFHEALAARELEPFFQPIVDLASGEPFGFEALARWRHRNQWLEPATFIPIATECGLTGELDLLIIEKALAAMPLLAQPVPGLPLTLSLNVSGILLEEPESRRRLLGLIDDNPRPPAWRLQVELVEDIFQDTSSEFTCFLRDLVERNVAVAIDDFGTGYSSLARLISLPIKTVKVDRAFVCKLADSDDLPRTLLRTMFTMIRDLNLDITAEGVETEQQRAWLVNNGVSAGQGYLFSPPMAIGDTISLLQQLDYRPRALPVDPGRIRAGGRRRLGSLFRLPFQARRRRSD